MACFCLRTQLREKPIFDENDDIDPVAALKLLDSAHVSSKNHRSKKRSVRPVASRTSGSRPPLRTSERRPASQPNAETDAHPAPGKSRSNEACSLSGGATDRGAVGALTPNDVPPKIDLEKKPPRWSDSVSEKSAKAVSDDVAPHSNSSKSTARLHQLAGVFTRLRRAHSDSGVRSAAAAPSSGAGSYVVDVVIEHDDDDALNGTTVRAQATSGSKSASQAQQRAEEKRVQEKRARTDAMARILDLQLALNERDDEVLSGHLSAVVGSSHPGLRRSSWRPRVSDVPEVSYSKDPVPGGT